MTATDLPISTKDVERFTPDDAKDRPDPPVYLIAVPSLMARAAWRRDIKAQGADYPGEGERFRVMREGVAAMARPEQQAHLLEIIAAAEAAREEAPRAVLPDPPELTRIGELLRQHWPPYAELLGERDYWLSVAPIMAARRFLVGWENVAAPFARQFGLVPEATIEALPEAHVGAIGWRAIGLMTLGKDQEKNSVSPPRLPANPSSTIAASAPPTAPDGASSATTTSATPAS